MTPLAVVEDLGVLEYGRPGLGEGGEPALVDQLDFERGEEALGDGVVPAVAPAAHVRARPQGEQRPVPAGDRPAELGT